MMSADEYRKSACKIIKEIRSKKVSEITKRDCMRADRKSDATTIAPVLEILVRDGYLMPISEAKHRGRPSERYVVNPAVHGS